MPEVVRTVRNSNDSKTIPEFCITNTSGQSTHLTGTGRVSDLAVNLPIGLLLPPIITHTAATPQGSPPSSALDSVAFYIEEEKNDQNNKNISQNNNNLNRSTYSVNLLQDASVKGAMSHHRSMVRTISSGFVRPLALLVCD